jgi:hypothetical protein
MFNIDRYFADIAAWSDDDGVRAIQQIHDSVSAADAVLRSQLLQPTLLRHIATNARLLAGRIVLLQVRNG